MFPDNFTWNIRVEELNGGRWQESIDIPVYSPNVVENAALYGIKYYVNKTNIGKTYTVWLRCPTSYGGYTWGSRGSVYGPFFIKIESEIKPKPMIIK